MWNLLNVESRHLHIHPYYSVAFSRHEKLDFYISKAEKRPSQETTIFGSKSPVSHWFIKTTNSKPDKRHNKETTELNEPNTIKKQIAA